MTLTRKTPLSRKPSALTAKVRKPKLSKCKICRKPFEKRSMAHKACKPECAAEVAKRDRERKERAAAKLDRADTAKRKDALKSRSDYAREAQTAINSLVRWRDKEDGCISCDKPATWSGQWHASHYKSVGSNPALRFDLANIHKSCSICNNWKSGNIGDYTPRLIAKIGQAEFDRINGPQPEKQYSKADLIELKKWAVAELKRLKAITCFPCSNNPQID
jgi:hypothetical protein